MIMNISILDVFHLSARTERERERKRERERERGSLSTVSFYDSVSILFQPVNVSLRQNKCMGRKHAFRYIYIFYMSQFDI